MKAARALVLVPLACTVVASLLPAACSGGEPANAGATEPMVVSGAEFIGGELPGSAPVDGGAPEGGAEPPLTVVQVGYQNATVYPGAAGKAFTGLVTTDAVAVGVRIADQGTGYWVFPAGQRDALVPNTLDFGFKASFDVGDAPGTHSLRAVAIDGAGNGGTQLDTELCFESRVPDNGHACDPGAAVPAVVFSLRWDVDFDVDLHVITPDGTDVNAKTNPLVQAVDSGQPPPTDPKIDRDSLRACVPDGWRQEDLVFPQYPATGPYDVYADPFAACGQTAVRFELTIYEAQSDGSLQATYTQGGELPANDTTGGSSTGLFIAEKVFN
ncbi:MAG TPA: hypothetical protein VGG39_36975 [Polyangiaceae bacterium]